MADTRVRARLRSGGMAPLLLYYGVAAVNTAVGYGLYAGFVAIGINLFLAQILSQLIGMAWNYVSYGRAVFRGRKASMSRYLAAYGVNYLLGLFFLALFHRIGLSAYLSGLGALFCASLINFLVLKRFVFRAPEGAAA